MPDAEPPSDPREPKRNMPPGFRPDGMPRGTSRQMKDRILGRLGRSDADRANRRAPDAASIPIPLWTELSKKVGGDLFQNKDKLEIMRMVDRTSGPDASWEDFSERVVAAISGVERSRAERAAMERRVAEKSRDPFADPCDAIRQWILDARLAGGIGGGRDLGQAARSAQEVVEGLRVGEGNAAGIFFDMGARWLWSYMVTMANEPGDEVVVDVSQARLSELAERQPNAAIRSNLLQAASYEDKVFSATRATLGLVGN